MELSVESQLEMATAGIGKKPFDTARLLTKLQELDEQFADELAALSSDSELLE
jgi:Holliday junction resolvasome RuvABC ATP-dependent DNA helicase subunit